MYSVSVLFVSLISKNIHSSIFVDFLVSTDLIYIFLFYMFSCCGELCHTERAVGSFEERDPPLQAQGQGVLQGCTHVQKVSTV